MDIKGYKGKFFLLLAIFCLLFVYAKNEYLMSSENEIHIKLADKITHSYVKEVTKDGKFWVEMTGGGMMGGTVNTISLGLVTIGNYSVDEARLLYVSFVEKFLKQLNANEEIMPYLKEYPATYKTFALKLSFNADTYKGVVGNDIVAYIFTTKQKIYYAYRSLETNQLEDLYEEPYQEALKIVREQHPEL